MTSAAGTALLLRQDLRRDRVVVPAWTAVLVLMAYASASATSNLFGTAAQRIAIATSINEQPGLLALYGPILDPSSPGELAMSKLTVLYALFSAILYVVLVRRHTRVEEESGRAELVAGTAIGRDAPLAAVAVECAAVAVVVGSAVAVADIVGGLPAAGALWFGVTWTGTGLVATGVGAIACQVSASARTCGSAAAAMLAGAFAVRAVGDAVDDLHRLSWFSPLGWNTQLRAWSHPRPWVALLYVVLTAGMLAVAQLMRSHRDLGSGLVDARPGPAAGRLAGPWGLTLRLHRTSLLVWTVGVAGLGVAFGAMTPGLEGMLDQGGGRELVDRLGGTFIAALLRVVAIVVTCFPIVVAGVAHHDEEQGRAGLVLASATSRARWFTATAAVGGIGAAWLLLVAGLALGAGYGVAGGIDAAETVPAALGWIPAVLVVAALALVGLALRVAWLGWSFLVFFLAITLVGELLELPGGLIDVSPFSAIPAYPAGTWSWTPLLVLSTIAAGLVATAWGLLRRRDVS